MAYETISLFRFERKETRARVYVWCVRLWEYVHVCYCWVNVYGRAQVWQTLRMNERTIENIFEFQLNQL